MDKKEQLNSRSFLNGIEQLDKMKAKESFGNAATHQVRLEDVADTAAEDRVRVVPVVQVPVGGLPRGRTPQGPELGQDTTSGEDALTLRFKPNLK